MKDSNRACFAVADSAVIEDTATSPHRESELNSKHAVKVRRKSAIAMDLSSYKIFDEVVAGQSINVWWTSFAIIPSLVYVALFCLTPLTYTKNTWQRIQASTHLYCDRYSSLTIFLGVIVILFFLRLFLQHFLLIRAFPRSKRFCSKQKEKIAREVTEVIARFFILCTCLIVVPSLSSKNGLELPYGVCNESNETNIVVIRCLVLYVFIIKFKLFFNQFSMHNKFRI